MLYLCWSRGAALTYLVTAVGASIVEILAQAVGVWQYTQGQFFGLPVWSPFAWGIAGVYVTEFRRAVETAVLQER